MQLVHSCQSCHSKTVLIKAKIFGRVESYGMEHGGGYQVRAILKEIHFGNLWTIFCFSGAAISYTNWRAGEPNEDPAKLPAIFLYWSRDNFPSNAWVWLDAPHTYVAPYFICEKSAF